MSRACKWVMSALSAVWLIYSLQFRPAFLSRCQPCGTAAYLVYQILDIGRRLKFEVYCTRCPIQGNDFELIPTIKMETRHAVEGSFDSEFPAIYNHCGVMAAWSRKTLNIFEKLMLSLLGGSRPKSARAAPDNGLRVLQILSKSVHFRRNCSNSQTREHRQNAP